MKLLIVAFGIKLSQIHFSLILNDKSTKYDEIEKKLLSRCILYKQKINSAYLSLF